MRTNVIGFCICCVLAVGCGEDANRPTPDPAAKGDPATSPVETSEKGKTDAAEAEITLKILDWEATEKLIAGHKGKVVVVDMWSTSCVPCIRELPNLVGLHKKYKEQVACISVSCDYIGIKDEPPESYREEVLEILKAKEVTFENVLSNVPSDELFEELGFASIPVVYVYGKDGELKKRFDNEEELYGEEGFTYQKDIIPFVEELLKGE
jgi:thiol-disulfide isomerase/thioredoxin